MFECNNISAGYQGTPAVRSINMSLQPGQVVSLIGANGAGKTTILRSFVGLISRMEGELYVNGERLLRCIPADMLARGVALVPEGRGIFAGLSVQENLLVGGFKIRDKAELESRLDEIYEMFPRLKERRHLSGALLSGGEQQMLAIGRALVRRPIYLLLDEPSMGLSPILVEYVADSIISLASKGMGILLAEQNAQFALGIADHGYVVENGSIALSGSAEYLETNSAVRRAYLGGGHE